MARNNPIENQTALVFPRGRRWRFRVEGVKYRVRYFTRGSRWSIRFRKNELGICIAGSSPGAYATSISVNGFTWEWTGTLGSGWVLLEGRGLPRHLPKEVVRLVNTALAHMEAHLRLIHTAQVEADRAKRIASDQAAEARDRALQTSRHQHLNRVLKQVR